MAPDEEDQNEETPPEEEAPEVDQRDQRIQELEDTLAAAQAQIDSLSQGLFAYQVSALDLLADPGALPYSADLVGNEEALRAAALALIAAQPDLAKIVVTGDVDQFARDDVEPAPANLLQIMKELI